MVHPYHLLCPKLTLLHDKCIFILFYFYFVPPSLILFCLPILPIFCLLDDDNNNNNNNDNNPKPTYLLGVACR